ncbi:DgyrCDS9160 [Dimorphilus gyrociliatus]|uniref:DgyrCDS9160 n=1 Tax=Dimorphilus gyrociliatus TaxID=2664684 RepID=A0A7I8VXI3_9ANNE|nr:DgyrCDS9160 [Dimorphilus gyrociliatus]
MAIQVENVEVCKDTIEKRKASLIANCKFKSGSVLFHAASIMKTSSTPTASKRPVDKVIVIDLLLKYTSKDMKIPPSIVILVIVSFNLTKNR